MTRFLIANVFLLIAFQLNLASAKDYKISELCPHSDLKAAFNQIQNIRPVIQLGNGTDSSAVVRHVWTDENLKDSQDCIFTVDSNLYSEYGQYNRHLFMSVRRSTLRFESDCIDYVRFITPELTSDKICGTFTDQDEIGKQKFYREDGGIIKVHISINKLFALTPAQRSVEVELLFTAFESCAPGGDYINCNEKSTDFCVSGALRNDGIEHCMPVPGKESTDKHGGRRITTTRGGAKSMHVERSLFYLVTVIALLIALKYD